MPAQTREERFLPGGVPRWIRCYDNGGRTADRYTIVFSGKNGGFTLYCSENPFHPQGVGQHAEGRVDEALIWGGTGDPEAAKRTRAALGKRIAFGALPERVRAAVLADYTDAWRTGGTK
jgi:hypothetical protein